MWGRSNKLRGKDKTLDLQFNIDIFKHIFPYGQTHTKHTELNSFQKTERY